MTLPGQVESATPSVPGFDSDSIIVAEIARQFFTAGYKFCMRYISLDQEAPEDLSAQEAIDILNSGLALMPVQHVHRQGWSPTQDLGRRDGENAVANAQNVGFPAGVSVWCDLEGVSRASGAQDVIDYCEAWYEVLDGAGYSPGLYVGPHSVLTGPQLYGLSFRHYWRSQSKVPLIPKRGYELIQLFPPITANGILIDIDVAQNDDEGGQAQWLRITL
jgi:glycoside hydrolase-like protein